MESMPKIPLQKIELVQTEPETGHLGILQNFADAILDGKELLAPGEEGIKELTISNAAYLSDWKEGWVDIPFEKDEFLRELTQKQQGEALCKEKNSSKSLKGKTTEQKKGHEAYEERWKVRW